MTNITQTNPNIPQEQATRVSDCQSCGCRSEFTYAGEQRWPERVAKAAGLPAVLTLWNCSACQTTLADTELSN